MPVRHEKLSGPLEGWSHDEDETIYTPSGYRCTMQQIGCPGFPAGPA
jgi:hypothetical protein